MARFTAGDFYVLSVVLLFYNSQIRVCLLGKL